MCCKPLAIIIRYMQDVDLAGVEAKATYVVAVSGGVDSIVLLDMLVQHMEPGLLVVAHFDHGIRENSADDALFVQQLAERYSCKYVGGRVELGEHCSEELARFKRYEFLEQVQRDVNAVATVLAHHQDDRIETAIINILRGTGPLGLVSLRSTKKRVRPFLNIGKNQIIDYAKERKLEWREDPTNIQPSYLRNRVRQALAAHASQESSRQLTAILDQTQKLTDEITQSSRTLVEIAELPRLVFTSVDYKMRTFLCAEWLRANKIGAFDRATITRLTAAICTLPVGKCVDIYGGAYIVSKQKAIALHVK